MAPSSIDVVLRLRNAKRFQQDASKSGKAVGDIGKGGKRAAKDLDKLDRKTKRLHTSFGHLGKGAKLALGAIGGAAAFGAAKNAIGATTDLTKRTLGLQRATKMDTVEASRWAVATKVRGVDAKGLNMAMGTLSKNMTLAGEGGKSQQKAFDRLGISQEQIKATGGDISKLLPLMADRFKAMGPSAERTASMMALMGRGWQTITPLMTKGSKAMDEQLKLADKYGATLHGNVIGVQGNLIQQQRELQIAQLGWQVQFSTQIAPRLVKAFKWILGVSQSLKGVFAWADKHPGIVKAIGSLVLLSAVMKRVPGGTWLTSHILSGTGGIAGKLLKRLGGPVKRALSSVLGRGGTAAGGRGAEALVNSTGSMFGRKSGKLNSTIGGRMSRIGKRAGGLGGKAAGIAFVAGAVIGLAGLDVAVQKVLRSVNGSVDKWAKDKFGAAGSVYSDIKGFIGDNYPQGLPGSEIIRGGLGTKRTQTGKVGPKIKHVTGRQHGGPLRAGRSYLTGEAGPELLNVRSSGAVIPSAGSPIGLTEMGPLATAGGGGSDVHMQPIILKFGEKVLLDLTARALRAERARQ